MNTEPSPITNAPSQEGNIMASPILKAASDAGSISKKLTLHFSGRIPRSRRLRLPLLWDHPFAVRVDYCRVVRPWRHFLQSVTWMRDSYHCPAPPTAVNWG